MRMGRATKTGLAAALAIAVVYAGLKAYIFFQTRDAFKQFIALASPFAFIQYGGIGSTLHRGAVHVTNVRITPNGMSEAVTLERLTYDPGGLWALLSMSRRLEARELPESLSIEARGLAVGLDGELTGRIEALAKARAPGAGGAGGAAHCAGLSTFGPGHLRTLGYQSLVSDFTLTYQYDRAASQLRMNVDGITRDLSSATFSMITKGPISMARAAGARGAPKVSEITMTYKDAGYTERLKRYCAQASGKSVEDYINAEVSQPPEAFRQQWGIVPGPGLREAYRNFLTQPGEVYVHIAPTTELAEAAASVFKPDELLAQLNATVKVNGQRVDDLSFSLGEPVQVAAKDEASSASADNATAPVEGISEGGQRPRARRAYEDLPTANTREMKYRSVPVDELEKIVGEYVRLTVGENRVREGSLTRVMNRTAYVEVRLAASSTIVVQIPFANIKTAEVLR